GQSATQHGAHARPSPDPSPLSLHDALPILAHNPHAAAVLAQNLDNMGFHPYTHAVVGMLNDKDIDGVIAKLASRIDHWYCAALRSEEHTSELQSREKLVCRLLLEKKKPVWS